MATMKTMTITTDSLIPRLKLDYDECSSAFTATPNITMATKRSLPIAEHSMPGKHKVAIGRRRAMITMGPPLLDEGPTIWAGLRIPLTALRSLTQEGAPYINNPSR